MLKHFEITVIQSNKDNDFRSILNFDWYFCSVVFSTFLPTIACNQLSGFLSWAHFAPNLDPLSWTNFAPKLVHFYQRKIIFAPKLVNCLPKTSSCPVLKLGPFYPQSQAIFAPKLGLLCP